MAEQKFKRVFAGDYQRYDYIYIRVLLVVDDVDTGEKIVLFAYEGKHNDGRNHCMTLKSFCEEVEVNGEAVPKFKRCTNRYRDSFYEYKLCEDGFEMPRKHIKKSTNRIRVCRQSSTYEEYAKDICVHYKEDLSRYNQTTKQKRWVGVLGQKEYDALKEDLLFLTDNLKTSLRKYHPVFKARYIDGRSIRQAAEDQGISRGSIYYAEKKLIAELASLLQHRDERDNSSRLNQKFI